MNYFKVLLIVSLVLALALPVAAQESSEKKKEEKITVDGSVRQRLEARYNYGPGYPDADAEFAQVLSRIRLGFNYKAADNAEVYVQFQDSRVWGEEASTLAATDNIDLHQGYFLLKNIENSGISLKVGRQELNYGDQRLVGAVGWHNVGRSFDAAKLIFSEKEFQVDAFYAQTTETFAGNTDTQFAGLYGMVKSLPFGQLDLYYFYKSDDREIYASELAGFGTLTVHTVGARLAGAATDFPLFYGGEFAWQSGDYGPDSLEAYALHTRIGVTLLEDVGLKASVEYNYATGDEDAADGTVETFDNLFPTNHNKYGYIDFIGWRNISDLRFSLAAEPVEGHVFTADYHLFERASDQDHVYNVGGAPLLNVPLSITETDIGQELDVTWKFRLANSLDIFSGYSYFAPGDLFEAVYGSEPDDAHFFYVQSLISF